LRILFARSTLNNIWTIFVYNHAQFRFRCVVTYHHLNEYLSEDDLLRQELNHMNLRCVLYVLIWITKGTRWSSSFTWIVFRTYKWSLNYLKLRNSPVVFTRDSCTKYLEIFRNQRTQQGWVYRICSLYRWRFEICIIGLLVIVIILRYVLSIRFVIFS